MVVENGFADDLEKLCLAREFENMEYDHLWLLK